MTVEERKKLFLPARKADRLIREHGALGESCARSVFSALVYGRAAAPVSIELRREGMCEAIAPVLSAIVDTVCRPMEALPADLAVEVAKSGICLCGGGEAKSAAAVICAEHVFGRLCEPQPNVPYDLWFVRLVLRQRNVRLACVALRRRASVWKVPSSTRRSDPRA